MVGQSIALRAVKIRLYEASTIIHGKKRQKDGASSVTNCLRSILRTLDEKSTALNSAEGRPCFNVRSSHAEFVANKLTTTATRGASIARRSVRIKLFQAMETTTGKAETGVILATEVQSGKRLRRKSESAISTPANILDAERLKMNLATLFKCIIKSHFITSIAGE